MARNKQEMNLLVGKNEYGEYVFLEDVFSYEDGGHCGATGFALRPITQSEYDRRTDPEEAMDYFDDIWRCEVQARATTEGLKEFTENCLALDGEDIVFDNSFEEVWEEVQNKYNEENTGDECVRAEVTSCGSGVVPQDPEEYEEIYCDPRVFFLMEIFRDKKSIPEEAWTLAYLLKEEPQNTREMDLLISIIKNPEDRDYRKVYADFLEEAGEIQAATTQRAKT